MKTKEFWSWVWDWVMKGINQASKVFTNKKCGQNSQCVEKVGFVDQTRTFNEWSFTLISV